MNQPKGGASMIFRGPHTDVSAPKINVVDFVLGDISAHENKTAIIQSETNRKISYREPVSYTHLTLPTTPYV